MIIRKYSKLTIINNVKKKHYDNLINLNGSCH